MSLPFVLRFLSPFRSLWLAGCLVCAALVASGAVSPQEVHAWPSGALGEPAALNLGAPADGVYLWVNDDNFLSVRVLGDRRYKLSFSLHYGQIYDLGKRGLDTNDLFFFSEDRGKLVVIVAGSDSPEGVDFKTEGNRVEITCQRAGDSCSLDEIFLGQDSGNPAELPFTLSRKDS